MEDKKENIIDMFYNAHLKVKDIADAVNTTSAYISKIVKQDNRYFQEKLFRKDVSKAKRKVNQNTFIKNKREIKKIEDNYPIVQAQHIQASRELSKSKHLSNEAYRKWNYSATSITLQKGDLSSTQVLVVLQMCLNILKKGKFEAILLTGSRPEEGCGLKWTAMDFEKDIVHINNAYKDWEIYDDNMKKIGHKRGDGPLKTDESYRDIPMHPRLKRLLLMIKAHRMEEYRKLGKRWDENEYIFLNQEGRPFVSENLTNKMPQFIKKYKLEHLTTYGLRHSFATLCSTLGMPPEVLHVIMGHADFDTTRKYYIHITEERKKNEMMKMYMKQNSEENLRKLVAETDKYFNKVVKLRVQDIRPEERLAG